MKTLLIYVSIHHGNTEKIAKVMAKVLNAKLVKPNEIDINELSKYDLIGFGSGIYGGKHHKVLLNFVDKLFQGQNKKAFIFSTSGTNKDYNKSLKEKLLEKGFDIVGEFSCKGFDTWGPFKIVGGINRGRPNEQDLKKARKFAEELKWNLQNEIFHFICHSRENENPMKYLSSRKWGKDSGFRIKYGMTNKWYFAQLMKSWRIGRIKNEKKLALITLLLLFMIFELNAQTFNKAKMDSLFQRIESNEKGMGRIS